MTIDINKFRADKGGDPDFVRKAEQRRCRSGSIVDKVIHVDNQWRANLYEMEQARKEQNAIAKDIGARKKISEDVAELVEKSTELKRKIPALQAREQELLGRRDILVRKIGNFVHHSVVVSKDEAHNAIIRSWGHVPEIKIDGQPGHLAHYEILARLGGVNLKKGNEVAGHRGYYLLGPGAMLNQALIQYGMAFLRKKGYTNVQPPYFMKREWMARAAELADFNETLYCIPNEVTAGSGIAEADVRKEDLFLIATSEQPLCALHAGDYLDKELPLKYAGISTCFRKEAGSHGKDMRGIFRVHQFEKVEQFIICDPTSSWDLHEEMIQISEEFYQSLNIPYRVVSIVSGALNDAAARKFDLEAWFPSYEDWRELVSCSNCTDFQSRDLNIRYGTPKMGEREKLYVHMLNGTLCASERTMCCLIEHYQREDGIEVPEVLRPFIDGMAFLPYKTATA